MLVLAHLHHMNLEDTHQGNGLKPDTTTAPCPNCSGRGSIKNRQIKCSECGGTGLLNITSNSKYWSMVFEKLMSEFHDNIKTRSNLLKKMNECLSHINK